jgi:hypothetical protein
MASCVTAAGGSNEAGNEIARDALRVPRLALRPCVLACLAGLCVSASAQDAMRLRGTIDSVNGELLRISPSVGISISVELKPQTFVQTVTKAQASELKEGVQIGAQVRTQPDATLNAVLIIIFATAEQAIQQPAEANLMVGQIVSQEKGEKGPIFTIKYADGQKRIVLMQDAQLWRVGMGQVSDLRKGSSVSLSATKEADGRLTTNRISVSPEVILLPPI